MILTRIALVALLGVVATADHARPAIERTPRRPQLSRSADSVQDLIDRFLRALESRDLDALRAMRVSKAEYLRIIMPGHVPPGAPPKRMNSQLRRFAWDMLNTKSMFYESFFLNTFSGEKLTLDRFEYREGIKEYAGYKAYRQLELILRDSKGEEHEVQTGSIAEVDGKYKFISFIRD